MDPDPSIVVAPEDLTPRTPPTPVDRLLVAVRGAHRVLAAQSATMRAPSRRHVGQVTAGPNSTVLCW